MSWEGGRHEKSSGSVVLAGGTVCSKHMVQAEFSDALELPF